MDSGFVYLLAVLCLVMLSVSVLRRSHQRRATSRDLTREQLARLRDQTHIRQSMEELLLQLEDVSRRINAQVDTRFMKLETVIRDADARIARLEQLTNAPRSEGHFPTTRTTAPSPGAQSPAPQPPPTRAAAPTPAAKADAPPWLNPTPAATDEFQPGLPLGAPPADANTSPDGRTAASVPARPSESETDRQADRTQERRTRIYELADGGAAPMTIADTLQIPLGEVELILNLRRFK